jgi:hypothetical protein
MSLMPKSQQSIVLPFGTDTVYTFTSAPKAFVLYCYLRGFGTKDAFTIPQLHTAQKFGWGKTTVRQAIRKLIAADLIEIAQGDWRNVARADEKTEGVFQPIWYRFTSLR